MNGFQFLLRAKSRLVRVLLAIFIANILMASTGLSAPIDWLEHEKSHISALSDQMPAGLSDIAPDQSPDQSQIKHECHASHLFQIHIASHSLTLPSNADCLLTISFLTPVLRESVDALFKPPR